MNHSKHVQICVSTSDYEDFYRGTAEYGGIVWEGMSRDRGRAVAFALEKLAEALKNKEVEIEVSD